MSPTDILTKERYLVTESYYLYADNDTEAVYNAKHKASQLDVRFKTIHFVDSVVRCSSETNIKLKHLSHA